MQSRVACFLQYQVSAQLELAVLFLSSVSSCLLLICFCFMVAVGMVSSASLAKP